MLAAQPRSARNMARPRAMLLASCVLDECEERDPAALLNLPSQGQRQAAHSPASLGPSGRFYCCHCVGRKRTGTCTSATLGSIVQHSDTRTGWGCLLLALVFQSAPCPHPGHERAVRSSADPIDALETLRSLRPRSECSFTAWARAQRPTPGSSTHAGSLCLPLGTPCSGSKPSATLEKSSALSYSMW